MTPIWGGPPVVAWDDVTDKPAFGTAALKDTGTTNGAIPLIGAGDVLPTEVLPALAITDTSVVASEAAMLALTAQKGDVAIRSDESKCYILADTDPAVLANWKEMLTPPDTVLSVNGQTGAVVISEMKSFVILNPVAGSDVPLWRAPVGITITAIHVQCTGGTSITGMIDEYDSAGAALVAAVDDTDITANAGASANDDGALSNPGIAAGNYLFWRTQSLVGSPTSITVSFEYTRT